MTTTRWVATAGLAALLAVTGCGDDEDVAAGGTDRYCELARELDEQEDFPSEEQLVEIREVAPEEIAEEADVVVTAFLDAIEAGDPGAAFADPAVEEAFGPIEAFDEEACGIVADDEEPDQDPSVTEIDPAATRVDVRATEYAFAFDPPAAGRTSFVMANEGEETHVMLLAQLAEGATLEEVLDAEDTDELVTVELESEVVGPDAEAVVTADLTPGEWALVCYIPNTGGEPHFGMAEQFTIS